MRPQQQIGILGLGNLLLRDEGFGVHFINYLTDHYEIPAHVAVLDGGTAGIMMAPFIEDADILYVIDTVALRDQPPGSIHHFSDQDIQAGNIHARMSPHQVGLLEILDLCRIRETAPLQTEMITVVPEDLERGHRPDADALGKAVRGHGRAGEFPGRPQHRAPAQGNLADA